MDRLRERPAWSMTGSEKLTALDQLQADLTHLSTRRLELLASLDTDGYATELGAGNTVTLIATRHRLDPVAVRRDLKLAHALPKYTAVNAALHTDPTTTPPDAETPAPEDETATNAQTAMDATGEQTDADGATGAGEQEGGEAGPLVLHPEQAAVIVDALEKIPSSAQVSAESLRFAEEQMVKAAQLLPPGELRKLGREVRNRLDTDGPEPAEKRAAANERLWLKRTDDGIKFGGFLAGDNAELLHTMVFAGAKPHKTPDGQRDPRSAAKRNADGLTDILHTAGATGAAPAHGGIKPHITVTINLADLIAGTGTGDLAHGGTLSAAAIRRLACDAGIIRLVLGANSEPLDVGTEERFVNRAMRRALNARDKGCVVCGAPPAMCEAHHIVHWANGGPTTVENLVLLCKAHHIDVHHGHWTITMTNGRPVLSRPDWATPTPTRTPTRAPAPAPAPTRPPSRTRPPGPTAPPDPAPDPWATGEPETSTGRPADTPPAGSPDRGPTGNPSDTAPESPPDARRTSPNTNSIPPAARGATPATTADGPAGLATTPTVTPSTPIVSPSPFGSTGAPPGRTTGQTSADPWRDDHATAPVTASGPMHAGVRPPRRATRPLGGFAHPLGDTASPDRNPIADEFRRNLTGYPDPWADDPSNHS
jgi:hypothetical protein